MKPIQDLATFVSSRNALHQVVEHVVAKARYVNDGKIGLTAFAEGIATPPLSDGRRVQVIGNTLLVGGVATVLTTIAEAARAAGVEPGLPTELYPAATPLEPDAPLHIDGASAIAIGEWYAFTSLVLNAFAAEIADALPSPLILWPEHFDQAFYTEDADESFRANYGASPGDAGHPDPYLYVGPWGTVPGNEFWNAPHFNGAVLSHSSLVAAADSASAALQFLRTGRSLLISH